MTIFEQIYFCKLTCIFCRKYTINESCIDILHEGSLEIMLVPLIIDYKKQHFMFSKVIKIFQLFIIYNN